MGSEPGPPHSWLGDGKSDADMGFAAPGLQFGGSYKLARGYDRRVLRGSGPPWLGLQSIGVT